MKKIFTLLGVASVVLGLSGLMIINLNSNQKKLSNTQTAVVATSIYPIEFLVKTIGGDRFVVETIVPTGVEPHDFEPNPAQMKSLETAGLVFLVGGGMEPWAMGLSAEKLILVGEKYMKDKDPHVWLDPLVMANMAAEITNILAGVQPQDRLMFEKNLAELQIKLNDLDSKMRSGLKSCQNRNMVVSHDAFSYLADRYALTQIEISGLSHEDEPSPRELADIATFVRQQNVQTIFLESLENSGLTETLATETGAKILPLSPLEMLSSEELNNGDNYLTLMEKNLSSLRSGLGCN